MQQGPNTVQLSFFITMEEHIIMAPHLGFSQLLLVTLVLIFLLIHLWWPDHSRATPHRPFKPDKPRRTRSQEPKPCTGLLHQPLCEACAPGAAARRKAPGSPPPVVTLTRGRRRIGDTHAHFCPAPDCSYHG